LALPVKGLFKPASSSAINGCSQQAANIGKPVAKTACKHTKGFAA
jgi:hypothetical protein